MESPASSVRRRAWISSSRQRLSVEDTDTQFTFITEDDVFSAGQANSPGCCTGKIENWFLTCRSASSEKDDQCFDLALRTRSIDDGLNIDADDSENNSNTHFAGGACHKRFLPSQSQGNNSINSSSTWNSTTSVAEFLQIYSENADETLYELGFGSEDPQIAVRIPPRFLAFPSLAKGINFRVFLDAQLQRIREEDPSLSLASRFRQVQMLTEMANAFSSLYSHVSRTPVQKLPTPEFNFSTPIERMERFRSSIRSDPRSPVDKLKDTVSKMCLYTGSTRESNSPLPSPNKHTGLPDIVDIVLEKPRHVKKLDIGQGDLIAAMDDQIHFNINSMEHLTSTAGEEANQNGNTNSELVYSEETDIFQTEECHNETFSGKTYVSSLLPEPGSSVCADDPKPLVKASYEHICPQIVECVHQVPFDFQHEHLRSTDTESLIAKLPILPSAESTGPGVNEVAKSRAFPSAVVSNTNSTCGCISVRAESESLLVSPTKKTDHDTNNQYLSPEPHITSNLRVNSFELEEVHSAGEDDLGQSETSSMCHFTGEMARGDSLQSDSSGYAEDAPSESQS